jgi:GTPase SAR1 family protein
LEVRPLLRHYYPNTQVIVHVVDSRDCDRIDESRKELHQVLKEDELRDCLVLVIANKQDLDGCMSVDEIREKLGFDELKQFKFKTIIGACATNGDGLENCLNWITTQYEIKKLARPFQETIDDVKNLVAKKSFDDNYISTYFYSLTKFVYKIVGGEKMMK